MPRFFITSTRIREITRKAETWPEIVDILRRHNIKYRYSTAGGTLHISIPGRSGNIRIIQNRPESFPVVAMKNAPIYRADN